MWLGIHGLRFPNTSPILKKEVTVVHMSSNAQKIKRYNVYEWDNVHEWLNKSESHPARKTIAIATWKSV